MSASGRASFDRSSAAFDTPDLTGSMAMMRRLPSHRASDSMELSKSTKLAEILEARRICKSTSQSAQSDEDGDGVEPTAAMHDVLEVLSSMQTKMDVININVSECLSRFSGLKEIKDMVTVVSERSTWERGPMGSPCDAVMGAPYGNSVNAGDDIVVKSGDVSEADVRFATPDVSLSEGPGTFSEKMLQRQWVSQHSQHSTSEERAAGKRNSSGGRARSRSVSELNDSMMVALSRVRPRNHFAATVWSFLEEPDMMNGGRTVSYLISMLIMISVVVPLSQTVEDPPLSQGPAVVFVLLADVVFALEAALRYYACPNRIAFSLNIFNVVDFLAGMIGIGLRSMIQLSMVEVTYNCGLDNCASPVLMVMCLVPLLRMFKLLRRFDRFHLIVKAFGNAFEALPVLLYILAILLLAFASIIYVFEPRLHPTMTAEGGIPVKHIDSMPVALWFTIVTMSTVGYGDTVPVTTPGTIFTSFLIVTSALYMAIPVGIVGGAFSAVWEDRERLLIMHRTRNRFLERGYKPEDIPAIFCTFDEDADGELNWNEFVRMMNRLEVESSTERINELFSAFDQDGSGAIDDAEFVRALFPGSYSAMYSSLRESVAGVGGRGSEESIRQNSLLIQPGPLSCLVRPNEDPISADQADTSVGYDSSLSLNGASGDDDGCGDVTHNGANASNINFVPALVAKVEARARGPHGEEPFHK